MLFYKLARCGITYGVNTGSGLKGWEQLDILMTFPRLLAFGACLAVMYMQGGLRKWGWHAGGPRRGLILLVMIILADATILASVTPQIMSSAIELLLAVSTTVAVVLFEESCFRGLLYLSLRQRYGAIGAATISSVIFMIFHWETQPISGWPYIFLFGMIACLAFELGTGLVWIAIAHEIVDVLYYISLGHGITHPAFKIASYLIFATALILALWWVVSKERSTHKTEDPVKSLSIREALADLGLIVSWILGFLSLRVSLLSSMNPKALSGTGIMFLVIAAPLLPPVRRYVYSVLCRMTEKTPQSQK